MIESQNLPRDFYYELKDFLDKWVDDKPTNQYLQKIIIGFLEFQGFLK